MAGENLLNKRVPELPELLRRLRNDDMVVVYDFVSDTTYKMRGENIVPGGLAGEDEYIVYEYPSDVAEDNPFMLANDRVMVVSGNVLYKLVYPSRPYGSTNLTEEIALGHWEKIAGDDISEWILAPDAPTINLSYPVSSSRYIVASAAAAFSGLSVSDIPNGKTIAINFLDCDGRIISLTGGVIHKNGTGGVINTKILPPSGDHLVFATHAVDEAGVSYILWRDAIETKTKELAAYDFMRQYSIGDTILDGDILYRVEVAWPSFDGTAEYPYFTLGNVPDANLKLMANLDGLPTVYTSNLVDSQGGQSVSINVQHQKITAAPTAPAGQEVDFLFSGRIPMGRRKILEYVWNGNSVVRSFNRVSGDYSIPADAVSGDVVVYDLYAYEENLFTIRRKYIQGKEGSGTGGTGGVSAVDAIEDGNMNASTSNAVFDHVKAATDFSTFTPYGTDEDIADTDVIAAQTSGGGKLKLTFSILRDWVIAIFKGKYMRVNPDGTKDYSDDLQDLLTTAVPGCSITMYSNSDNIVYWCNKSVTINTNGFRLSYIRDKEGTGYVTSGAPVINIRIVGGGIVGGVASWQHNTSLFVDVEVDTQFAPSIVYILCSGVQTIFNKLLSIGQSGNTQFGGSGKHYVYGGIKSRAGTASTNAVGMNAGFTGEIHVDVTPGIVGSFSNGAIFFQNDINATGKTILHGAGLVENTTTTTPSAFFPGSAVSWYGDFASGKLIVNGHVSFKSSNGGPTFVRTHNSSAKVISVNGSVAYNSTVGASISFENLAPGRYPVPGTGGTGASTWSEITDKPTAFPPVAHTHLWAEISDKPAFFTPSDHVHAVFSVDQAGFVPARIGNVTTKFLREDGTWVTPTNTTYSVASDTELVNVGSTTGRLISGQRLNAWAVTKGFLTSLPAHNHNWSSISGAPNFALAENEAWAQIQNATTVTADYAASKNLWHVVASITSLSAINIPNGKDLRLNFFACDGRTIALTGGNNRDHLGSNLTELPLPSTGSCYVLVNHSVDAGGSYLSWTILDEGSVMLGDGFIKNDQQETQVITYQPGTSLSFLPDPLNEWSQFGTVGQGDYIYKAENKLTPYGIEAQGEIDSRDAAGVTTDYYTWNNQPVHWVGLGGGMDGFGHTIKFDNSWSGQYAGLNMYAGSTAGRESKIEFLVDWASRLVILGDSISLGVYSGSWKELVITAAGVSFDGKPLATKDEDVEVITLAGSVANVTMDSNRDAYISGGATPGTIAIGGTPLPNKFRVIPVTGNGAAAPEVTGALPEPNVTVQWVAANPVNTLYLRTGYSPTGTLSTYYMWV